MVKNKANEVNVEEESEIKVKPRRIQTAEGWKRGMLKEKNKKIALKEKKGGN